MDSIICSHHLLLKRLRTTMNVRMGSPACGALLFKLEHPRTDFVSLVEERII